MNVFTEPHFQSDEEARKFLERIRWTKGPECPHCGECEKRYATKREGRYRCASCRKDFTVTTKTVMEFQPHRPAQVADGVLSDVRLKEGRERTPAYAFAWRYL